MTYNIKRYRAEVVPLIALTMGDELAKEARAFWVGEPGSTEIEMFTRHVRGKLVGMCGLGQELAPDKVWLSYFAVHPDYRGRGYARALLEKTERLAVRRGYHCMYVLTYHGPVFLAARQFYKRAGYTQFETTKSSICLRKRLDIIKACQKLDG